MIYVSVLITLLLLSLRYDINGKTKYRNEWYFIMLVVFVLIAGLRYRLGIDTTRYLNVFYYKTPKLDEFTADDFEIGADPIFKLLCSFVLTMGGKFYVVQLLHATFVNTLIFRYIKKHTRAIFVSISIYFIYQYASMNMEEMRASMGLVLCLFANDFMLEHRWLKGVFLYVLGCMCHFSIILLLLMPLFFFLRFNKVGVCILVGSFMVGMSLGPIINELIPFIEVNESFDVKFQRYASQDSYMEGNMNLVGYLAAILLYSYSIMSLYLIKKNKIHSDLIKLEPLLMIFFLFVLMNVGIPVLYRYVRLYVLYYILFVSEYIVYLFKRRNGLPRNLVALRAIVILLPFFLIVANERLSKSSWPRYHPYSSIFDQELDMKRESLYSSFGGERPIPGKY